MMMTCEGSRKNAELNEWRKMLVKNHLCRNCGKQDAYTIAGRSYCADCAEWYRNYRATRPREEKERQNANARQRRIELVANHVCVICRKPLPIGYEKQSCESCLNRKRIHSRAIYHLLHDNSDSRGDGGRCWKCNKAMAMPGRRLCQKCYDEMLPVSLANIAKANERRKKVEGR